MFVTLVILILVLVGAGVVLSMQSHQAPPLGLTPEDRLQPCGTAPNCVSSDHDAHQPNHHVAPLRLLEEATSAWPAVLEAVTELPRTRIIVSDGPYCHAVSHSRVFRFVDDLELHLRPEEQSIAVRSASRVGYSDLGVNRARVEELRQLLASRGLVEPD